MNKYTTFIIVTTILAVAGLFLAHPVLAQEQAGVDYSIYAKILKSYVNEEGRVNYEALRKDRKGLDTFVAQVEKADLSGLSEQETKTFWLNAYNAITLKTVLNKYPVKSIRKINFGLVWEVPRKAASKKYSLGHIEHKIVRPLGDPRVHFALNCASIGCPKLPKHPFDSQHLDEQLDYETRRFMNDPEKVRLDRSTNTLYHSELFDWFNEDFLLVAPDTLSYIKKYINDDDRVYLEQNEVSLKPIKYDWDLNKQ